MIGSHLEGCQHLEPRDHEHVAILRATGRVEVTGFVVATASAFGSRTKHIGKVRAFTAVDGVFNDEGSIEAKVEFAVPPIGLFAVDTDRNEFPFPIALFIKFAEAASITVVAETFSDTRVDDNDFTSRGKITAVGEAHAVCREKEDP